MNKLLALKGIDALRKARMFRKPTKRGTGGSLMGSSPPGRFYLRSDPDTKYVIPEAQNYTITPSSHKRVEEVMGRIREKYGVKENTRPYGPTQHGFGVHDLFATDDKGRAAFRRDLKSKGYAARSGGVYVAPNRRIQFGNFARNKSKGERPEIWQSLPLESPIDRAIRHKKPLPNLEPSIDEADRVLRSGYVKKPRRPQNLLEFLTGTRSGQKTLMGKKPGR